MYNYTLRKTAKENLEEIGRYTQKKWGVDQRNKYLLQLSKRFVWLAENPLFGKEREEIKSGYLSYNEGSHVIFYIIKDNSIDILAILHESMEPKRHLGIG